MFSKGVDEMGSSNMVTHGIDTGPGESALIKQHPRRLPLRRTKAIMEMREKEIIDPSTRRKTI
jgi:hypothetical protein